MMSDDGSIIEPGRDFILLTFDENSGPWWGEQGKSRLVSSSLNTWKCSTTLGECTLFALLQLWLMMMTIISSTINHVYNNVFMYKCWCSRVERLDCNVHIQVHSVFLFFFLHFLTDPFYSQDPRAAITKRSPCQPQSQSQESTYNGQFQPGKPQQSRLVFRARCLKSQEQTGQAGEQEQY